MTRWLYLLIANLYFVALNASPLYSKDRIITKSEVSQLISLVIDGEFAGRRGWPDCLFSSRWSAQEISKSHIKEYLGISLSSNLTPTSQRSLPSEYLKASGVPQRAICDETDTSKFMEEASIGFPIFNNTHTVALMTLSQSVSCPAREESGKKVTTSSGSTSLLVFRRKKKWKLAKTEEISNWDGMSCKD